MLKKFSTFISKAVLMFKEKQWERVGEVFNIEY